MIITKKYAQKLVREGKARLEGRITDQPRWADRHTGHIYRIVIRHDKCRVDHYLEN